MANKVWVRINAPYMNDATNDRKRALVKEMTDTLAVAFGVGKNEVTIRITGDYDQTAVANDGLLFIDR
jgi:hypothetical protein